MSDLFSSIKKQTFDINKIELSKPVKKEKKIVELVKVKKEERISKVSSEAIHPFPSEFERWMSFPNPPVSLKELKMRNLTESNKEYVDRIISLQKICKIR